MYTEDSIEPLFPLNIPTFNITDDDNAFLMQAIIVIENSDAIRDSNATDSLFIPGSAVDSFMVQVSGNGTSRVEITASGPRSMYTLRPDFVEYLRQLSFTSDDQSPFIVRNLTVTVEEFPSIVSQPTSFYIEVIPVNDRPVLRQSSVSELILDSYLPQEISNPGFNASFLLPEDNYNVIDIDRNAPNAADFIGLAVINEENGDLGVWEFWDNGAWVEFPAISDCLPLFLRPDQRVRFLPAPSYSKLDGNASFTYRVWDGTSSSLMCLNGSVEITEGTIILLVNL